MANSELKDYKKGDFLIRQGEDGDCAYVIESGEVEILIKHGKQLVQISTRGAGSIIGEMSIIDDKPRTASIRAIQDCRVLRISREDFSHRVEKADPILKTVLQVILTRYRDMLSRSNFNPILLSKTNNFTEEDENKNTAHDLAVDTIKVHNELKNALENNELTLFYQPIIDIQNMKIAGFEALMRWIHPEKGMISPGIFIPVAEESGLIVELSTFALNTSCDDIKKLTHAADPALLNNNPLFMSVNFSAQDFFKDHFFEDLCATLKDKEVKPEQIHIEITESVFMGAPDTVKDVFHKCQKNNFSISLDDFGTGYSSLAYLHHFPVNILKIDQSFIRSMNSCDMSLSLVKAIITLAQNINMEVIAEGIESKEDAQTLHKLGCENIQGYWFGKPMPLDKALDFVKSWSPPDIS